MKGIMKESQFGSDSVTPAKRELPKFRSHKIVYALKIKGIVDPSTPDNESDGSMIIEPAEWGYAPFRVPASYFQKHQPQVGGYYVVYEDGYKSFSPAKAFESGYTKIS